MTIIRDKSFYKMIAGIGIPIACQNLITHATGIADSLMLGRADDTGVLLSACTLANNPFFILTLVCFGLASGSAILSAQYWGKQDMRAIRAVVSMVIKVGAAVGLLFGLCVLIFPGQVMRLFSTNPAIIEAGVQYLKIIGFAYLFFAANHTMLCAVRGVGIVKLSVAVNLSGFFINVFLNWVLIFGNLGAPALGIRGAAIATLAARLIEFVIGVTYIFFFDKTLGMRPRHLKLFNGQLARDLARYCAPVVVNETMWSLAISVQSAILGHITYSAGDPVAANSIATIIFQLASVATFGVANAAAVIVGRAIGEGDEREARRKAEALIPISVLLGLATFGVIMLARPFVLGMYKLPEATLSLSHDMIFVTALSTVFVSISSVTIVGILRGAGDTTFCLVTEMVMLWCVGIPAALVAAVLHAPVPLVLAFMKMDEALKSVCCLIRLRGKKWLNSVTREGLEIAEGETA